MPAHSIVIDEPGHLLPENFGTFTERIHSIPGAGTSGPFVAADTGTTGDGGGGLVSEATASEHTLSGGTIYYPEEPGSGEKNPGSLGGPGITNPTAPVIPGPNSGDNPPASSNPNPSVPGTGSSGECTADPVTCALIAELQGGSNTGGSYVDPYGFPVNPNDLAGVGASDNSSAPSSSPWVIVIIVGVIAVVGWYWYKHRKRNGAAAPEGERPR